MDIIDIGRYLGALLLVLGLIGFAAYGARRFSLPGLIKPIAQRRLQILESLSISPRQRLVLIRRDDREHLVMIGDGCACVVERDIVKPEVKPESAVCE
jgi:flagellar protein FliO/FliZ